MRLTALGEHPGFWLACSRALTTREEFELVEFVRELAEHPTLAELGTRGGVELAGDVLSLVLSDGAVVEFDVMALDEGYALVGRTARAA